LSVYDAFEYVMAHYYPAGTEAVSEGEAAAVRKDTYAVISIQDSGNGGFGVAFTENAFCKGVLTLLFDDVYRETPDAVLFSDEMAVAVIRFIDAHRDAETLLVHCYAGQSRSRAVGAFALKYLGGRNDAYVRTGSPNMHVYNTLLRAAGLDG
jgi:predicted protein tyrosine phosphatase